MFKQPNISDWANWVSPSSLRNYITKDCILDWLGRYGESKGFIRDDHLPGFDPDINFLLLIAYTSINLPTPLNDCRPI